MDYEKAFKELDEILTADNFCRENKLDTVYVNAEPFATTTHGEALRPLLREEIAYEMEDFNLTAQEATDKIVTKIKGLDEDGLTWWKQNGWLQEVL